MQLLRFLVGISRVRIAAVVIAGLVCGVANTYLLTLINGVVSPEPHPKATLPTFVVTCLVVLVSGLIAQLLQIGLAQDAIYRLRAELSTGIASAPLEHLERLGTHRLIATLTEDVRSLSTAVTAIPSICIDLATIVGCFVFLVTVSTPLFAISVIGTLIGIACVETFLRRVRETYRQARENEDALLRSFQAVTLGIKELKLHHGRRHDFMGKHLLGTADELRRQNSSAGGAFSVAQALGQLMQLGTMALILFVVAASMDLPRDVMIGYVLVTTFLAMPMQNFMHRIPDLLRGDVALAKITHMNLSMQSPHNEEQLPYAGKPPVDAARVELAGISYTYPPAMPADGPLGPPPGMPPPPGGPGSRPASPYGPDVNGQRRIRHGGRDSRPMPARPPAPEGGGFRLGPVDLVFSPGEVTFVVGGNGSGKSTLAKVVTGLYVPRSGTIRINGEAVDHENIEWYRQNCSAVFTDFHLFEDYLGFEDPELDERVRHYLDRLQIADKVDVKDGRLSTIALSQGQRKRLALLTTLLEDRPLYLFDEWAADQEPQFRETFYREILSDLKRQGKTVIVITHDDRYFDCADRIVKLDLGKVAQTSASQPPASPSAGL